MKLLVISNRISTVLLDIFSFRVPGRGVHQPLVSLMNVCFYPFSILTWWSSSNCEDRNTRPSASDIISEPHNRKLMQYALLALGPGPPVSDSKIVLVGCSPPSDLAGKGGPMQRWGQCQDWNCNLCCNFEL